MSTVPAGLPAWSRTADHTVYGGNLNKINYQSRGVINARTDVGADQFVRMVEDLAAVTRVAPFCRLTYTADDSTPAAPTVSTCALMTGVATSSYLGSAPPTGFPALARSSTGVTTITFASSYTDAYGIAQSFTPTQIEASLASSTLGAATWAISGNVVTIYANNASGAVSNAKVTVSVW